MKRRAIFSVEKCKCGDLHIAIQWVTAVAVIEFTNFLPKTFSDRIQLYRNIKEWAENSSKVNLEH